MESGKQVADRFSAALATICDSTHAQLAFIYADSAGRVTEMIGDETPSPQLVPGAHPRVAARFPRGGLWQRDADEPTRTRPPARSRTRR